jgi:hypothetical protein
MIDVARQQKSLDAEQRICGQYGRCYNMVKRISVLERKGKTEEIAPRVPS